MYRAKQPVILFAIKGPDSAQASSLGFWVLYLGAVISNLHDTVSTTTYAHCVSSASEFLSKEVQKGEGAGKRLLFLNILGISLRQLLKKSPSSTI